MSEFQETFFVCKLDYQMTRPWGYVGRYPEDEMCDLLIVSS